MIIDNELVLSDAQAITADAASTNYIDTQVAGRAIHELFLNVIVDTTFDTSGEAGTLVVSLQSDSDSAFGTATTHFSTASIAEATLVKGYKCIQMRLPFGMGRYIRCNYDVNNSDAFTAGKINAFLSPNTPLNW